MVARTLSTRPPAYHTLLLQRKIQQILENSRKSDDLKPFCSQCNTNSRSEVIKGQRQVRSHVEIE